MYKYTQLHTNTHKNNFENDKKKKKSSEIITTGIFRLSKIQFDFQVNVTALVSIQKKNI